MLQRGKSTAVNYFFSNIGVVECIGLYNRSSINSSVYLTRWFTVKSERYGSIKKRLLKWKLKAQDNCSIMQCDNYEQMFNSAWQCRLFFYRFCPSATLIGDSRICSLYITHCRQATRWYLACRTLLRPWIKNCSSTNVSLRNSASTSIRRRLWAPSTQCNCSRWRVEA